MVQYSAEYLNDMNGLDRISIFILQFISTYLDKYGAWEWDLNYVALYTTIALGCIRLIFKKYRGIDWYAFIHALISSLGSLACLYLNAVTSAQLSSSSSSLSSSLQQPPEPLRSILCYGPLTSLHRILPAITMGYSIFDFLDGLTISIDFVIHGFVTFSVMYTYIHIFNAPHIMSPMLFMEGSTIFLTIVKADFFPSNVVLFNQMCFTFAFFICRLIVVPLFWLQLVLTMYENRNEPTFQQCFPSYFTLASFLFGMFYNILNTYWFIKIIRKARRKILGLEKPNENNDLSDEADPSIKLSQLSLQSMNGTTKKSQ
jgi:hypothetical protein